MATAQTLIDRALRLISAIEAGASPTADESADGLEALNAMLASWNNDTLSIYAYQDESITLVNGTNSYTLGPTGTKVTTRPIRIIDARVVESSTEYPVELITKRRWDSIAYKATTSNIASMAYYEPSMPNGTLYVYPTPSTGNTLKIATWVQLSAFATLATTVTLPPGFERALAYNLAVEIAPEYEREAPPTVQRIAESSREGLRIANKRPIMAVPDITFAGNTGQSDIYADGSWV